MKTIGRKVIIASIVILGLCLMNITALAEPAVESYSTDPAKPKRQADITVTATISSDNDVYGVRLFIQECKRGDQCYPDGNQYLTMEPIPGTDDWETSGTLVLGTKVDYITYWFYITEEEGGEEIVLTEDSNGLAIEVDLDVSGDSSSGDDDDDNGSPGFELLTLIVAIGVALILIKRKRS